MLNGIISFTDSPTKFDGKKPKTPGRFFEILTILPTSSRMLMKTTAVRYEKKRSLT